MAAHYKNQFETTDNMLMEYLEIVLRRRPWKGGALIIILAAVAVISSVRNGNISSALVFALCLFIVVTAQLVTPSRRKKKVERDLGKSVPISVTMGGHIEQRIGGVLSRVEYRDITAIYYLPHVWVLTSGKGRDVLLSPHSFVDGKPEECQRFLEQRCSNISIHRAEEIKETTEG